ncbi:hypothetical protein SBA4_1800009 [Candidatus Sulfopaludibacter sp. SbA4]|nr:hypothetical protein SBA4_1800009 [Candidatus Sulfopaludibacter sp. SbA4]
MLGNLPAASQSQITCEIYTYVSLGTLGPSTQPVVLRLRTTITLTVSRRISVSIKGQGGIQYKILVDDGDRTTWLSANDANHWLAMNCLNEPEVGQADARPLAASAPPTSAQASQTSAMADFNGDGIPDTAEIETSGVVVSLVASDNTVISTFTLPNDSSTYYPCGRRRFQRGWQAGPGGQRLGPIGRSRGSVDLSGQRRRHVPGGPPVSG